jgi:hypothetical protein
MKFGSLFALGAVLGMALASPAAAQIRASELAAVSQTIDGTRLNIEYSAPRARGRTVLFGSKKAVQWNEVWTPGANYATTLETNKPITLDGHAIPAGKYALWMTVRANGAWTMMLDPDAHRFHEDRPDSNANQIRFMVHPTVGAFEDVLQWRFSKLSATGATLSMAWGTTHVAMKVGVTPSMRMTTPADEAAPMLGRYDWKWTGADSAKKYALTMVHENGYLMGHMVPRDAWPVDFALIRLKPDWYTFGLFEKGIIVDVETTWVLEFTRDAAGAVTSFEIRDDTDKLYVKGTRRP